MGELRADLDVCDSFKVGDEVLDESLPRREAPDQDVGRAQLERAYGGSVSIRVPSISAREGSTDLCSSL